MRRERKTFQRREGEQTIFRAVTMGRSNSVLKAIKDFLFAISSYPSFISEIFLRRKFGERYFTTATAFVILFLMIWLWLIDDKLGIDFLGFTWLPFAFLIVGLSIKHRLEIKKFGTAYNFNRYSYSDGEILSFWWKIIDKEFYGIHVSYYRFYTVLEPSAPILAGLFLWAIPFTRGVGMLLFISGLSLCFRNLVKTHTARGFVLDIIDEQIVMGLKHEVLVEEKPMYETKGLSLPIELPKSIELRQQLSNSIDTTNPLDIWEDDPTGNELSPV